jgi:hypothetical protein
MPQFQVANIRPIHLISTHRGLKFWSGAKLKFPRGVIKRQFLKGSFIFSKGLKCFFNFGGERRKVIPGDENFHGDGQQILENFRGGWINFRKFPRGLTSVESLYSAPDILGAQFWCFFYIFTIKFSKSWPRNFQAFHSGWSIVMEPRQQVFPRVLRKIINFRWGSTKIANFQGGLPENRFRRGLKSVT